MTRARTCLLIACCAALAGTNALARDSLGVFSGWAAFRDASIPRCYAIAKPEPIERESRYAAYASIGTWPKRGIYNQLHFRLSQDLATGARISLRIGNASFTLTGGGSDAWASDAASDAAIVASIRSANQMAVRAVSKDGRRFSDSYALAGAATAIDAATLACSGRAR